MVSLLGAILFYREEAKDAKDFENREGLSFAITIPLRDLRLFAVRFNRQRSGTAFLKTTSARHRKGLKKRLWLIKTETQTVTMKISAETASAT